MASPEGPGEPASARAALPLRQAAALGLLHGPAELLPISSSGHTTLVPWIAGWRYAELEPELRKSFEVALHAGTAAALLIALRAEIVRAVRELDRRRVTLLALSLAPPALCALAFERTIERRLGTPATIAAGLAGGSVAMAAADICGRRDRRHEDAGARDGLILGLAQACALVPGVSRNGATLAAARARGFGRADANELSRRCALPVIAGAAAFRGRRLAQSGGQIGGALTVGALSAFASTLGSSWLVAHFERGRSLLPYAAYRVGVAALVVRRLRENPRR